jgi:hypothetical protein
MSNLKVFVEKLHIFWEQQFTDKIDFVELTVAIELKSEAKVHSLERQQAFSKLKNIKIFIIQQYSKIFF